MTYDNEWYAAALLLSVGITIVLYVQLRSSLQKLLAQCIRVPEGTTFFLRSFFVGLLLVTLGQGLGRTFEHKPGAKFMEYVWSAASVLSDVFLGLYLAIGLTVILVTILVATLKPNHDK